MNARMSEAEFVICRAGAMTISELALMGKAAVFVPSPNVAANHQYLNAKMLYDANACSLVEEKEFKNDRLILSVEELLSSEATRKKYEANIKQFATLNSNEVIYNEIKKIMGK